MTALELCIRGNAPIPTQHRHHYMALRWTRGCQSGTNCVPRARKRDINPCPLRRTQQAQQSFVGRALGAGRDTSPYSRRNGQRRWTPNLRSRSSRTSTIRRGYCYGNGGHMITDEYFFFFVTYSYTLTQQSDIYVGPTPRYSLTTYSAQPG